MLFDSLSLSSASKTTAASAIPSTWLSDTIQRCISRVKLLSSLQTRADQFDTRPATSEVLLKLLASQLSSAKTAQLENTSLQLLETYQAVSKFFPQMNNGTFTQTYADTFPAADVIEEYSEKFSRLESGILSIDVSNLEDLVDISVRINHCFNIMSEVERLSRTKGSGSLESLYEEAKKSGITPEDIDRLVIIWTGTAHPNRFVTLAIENTISDLVDQLVTNPSISTDEVKQLFCTMLKAKVIPDVAPKRSAEASYVTRTFAESGVDGLKKLYRHDLAARRAIWGEAVPPPSYNIGFHIWPTFDWDGQRNPDYTETSESIKRSRDLACERMTSEINSIFKQAPEHIIFDFEGSAISVKDLLARFINRLRALHGERAVADPISQEKLCTGFAAMRKAISQSEDADVYKKLTDNLGELLFLSQNIGVHLATGEHRQNSQYQEKVISQIQAFLGLKAYENKTEEEKVAVLTKLLSNQAQLDIARKEMASYLASSSTEASQYLSLLDNLREELLFNPRCCDRAIISLTTSTSDILETELLLRLAGINCPALEIFSASYPRLEIVPLFERPEDKIVCDDIFKSALEASGNLLNLCKSHGRLNAMVGYSDGQMRGGPGDRELSREVEERISALATSFHLEWAIEHGLGPGVGRGGGFNGDQSMLTNEAVQSEYIHFTVQGTAIGKLLRVSASAARQAITGIRNYVEGLQRKTFQEDHPNNQQNEFKEVRKKVYKEARDLYEGLTGRGTTTTFAGQTVEGQDIFFTKLGLMFPPEYLKDLKQVSRPLFRFEQSEHDTFFNGLQKNPKIWLAYEDFRAVPNSQISDGTRLCYLSLYSWGTMIDSIRKEKGNEFLCEMYKHDRAFQADFNGALLALQGANIPYSLALYRAQYLQDEDKPLVKELLTMLDKIEYDYRLLLEGVAVVEPVISKRVKSTITEIRRVRSLKDPTIYVLQTVRAVITAQSHRLASIPERIEAADEFIEKYSRLNKLISVAMGTSLDTGS